ncbi:GMC family oxidoreductase [Bordetella trematum]|uniref:GMC family oxidoreductase n=1 Tax=Bordetella trematum TaxID=123899 RepID=UPI003AF3D253
MSSDALPSSFDYIIIGAGSAGCALAHRLSEDSTRSVALIEAGPWDRDKWLHIPIGIAYLLKEKRFNWFYHTEPEPGMHGRRIYWPRGKVMGGSSSINGMVYIRGQPQDFARWEAEGATGWGWDTMLRLFKRCEDQARGEDAYHGVGGPIRVEDRSNRHPLWDAFIASAQAAGFAFNPDFNGPSQEGVGYYQTTIRRGVRNSAATGYIKPIRARQNLHILTDTLALRLLLRQRQAEGVLCRQAGRQRQLLARRGVILAAGAINSPQLLMLSGIGPGTHLQSLGIPVVHDAPDVGRNLQDHLQLRLVYRLRQPISFNEQARSWRGKARMLWDYAVHRGGPMAYPTAQTALFARSCPEAATPDLQYHFSNYSIDSQSRLPDAFPGITYSVCYLRPQSRGELRLSSAEAGDAPLIRANYLSAAADCAAAIRSIQLTRKLAQTSPMRELIAAELAPGPGTCSDSDMLDFARANGSSIYHPAGTCRMGRDALAVLDPQLRVRGIDRLWVADASVMPSLVSGNTNAAALAIGERGAELILEHEKRTRSMQAGG